MDTAQINKLLSEKIKEGRQYRSMQMECRKAEEDSNEKIVEGYFTTFNESYLLWEGDDYKYYERVSETAFDECDLSDVILQYDHQGRVFARLSNGTLKIEKDSHGMKCIADLGGTTIGRSLYEEIKGGYTNKMSFGFIVEEDEEEELEKENGKRVFVRTITKIKKLFDCSAVSLPANDGTEISARAYIDGVIEARKKAEAQEEAERLAKEEEARKEAEQKEQELRERMRLRALALN